MHATSRHKHMEVQRTREIKLLGDEFTFPLRDVWLKANETLDGVNEHIGTEGLSESAFDLAHAYELKEDSNDGPEDMFIPVVSTSSSSKDNGGGVLAFLEDNPNSVEQAGEGLSESPLLVPAIPNPIENVDEHVIPEVEAVGPSGSPRNLEPIGHQPPLQNIEDVFNPEIEPDDPPHIKDGPIPGLSLIHI